MPFVNDHVKDLSHLDHLCLRLGSVVYFYRVTLYCTASVITMTVQESKPVTLSPLIVVCNLLPSIAFIAFTCLKYTTHREVLISTQLSCFDIEFEYCLIECGLKWVMLLIVLFPISLMVPCSTKNV